MNAAPLTTFHHSFKPGSGLDAPTLVLLHGTGGNENALLELGRALSPDANLLGIRGRSQEEGQNRFFRRYAEGVFDEHDIALQGTALAQFLEQARETYHLTGPFIAVGYSNGANMAAAMLLTEPKAFQSAVLFRPMSPFNELPKSELAGVKVLLLNGESDPMAPLDSAKALAEALRESGADVTHRIMPTGHQLSRADVQVALAWLVEP